MIDSDTGNRTPSCRVRGGNVSRYTISETRSFDVGGSKQRAEGVGKVSEFFSSSLNHQDAYRRVRLCVFSILSMLFCEAHPQGVELHFSEALSR